MTGVVEKVRDGEKFRRDCQQNVALLKSREERGIYGSFQVSDSRTRLVEDIKIAGKKMYIYDFLRVFFFPFKYYFFFLIKV